jgi:hypothetical protein|tara:strand:- start:196 stop:366 length:171 start_codon:yes stop_codon:yes gene_type:complete
MAKPQSAQTSTWRRESQVDRFNRIDKTILERICLLEYAASIGKSKPAYPEYISINP